jgi:hypothetical protein
MNVLTEKEMVRKVIVALDLMGMASSDAPEGTTFVGARKLRKGGVILQMNSEAVAEWIKQEAVMKMFLKKMGGACIAKTQLLNVVAEFVPTTFDPSDLGALEEVECNSGLARMSMMSVRFIKPTHLRKEGQKTAHAIIGFSDRAMVNHAIENGVFVEGKHVGIRKLQQEPKRCLKCQEMGVTHVAANCKSLHDVCAQCRGLHWTANCTVEDPSRF